MQFDQLKRREFITLLGGAAVAWPLAAPAQQPTTPVIGFMSARSPEDSVRLVEAFRRSLQDGGFVEGQNVTVEYRWARGEYGRLPALAKELVDRKVGVLLGIGGDSSTLAAKAATSTIPVIFGMGSDPVQAGMVASLNRPGGNVTGVNLLVNELEPKRLGLLNDLVPGSGLIGALLNSKFPPGAQQAKELREAAGTIGRPIIILAASNDAELDAAFATLIEQRAVGLLVGADPFFSTRGDRIIAFGAQHRLPAIYHFRDFVLAGGLMSYGVSLTDAYRHFGAYAARILKGAKPADLPVQQSVKFETVINLNTAKALGVKISDNLLSLADEVIE
jgi:putative tryptophan/tyrosine transport system substrate-binding protein